MAAMEPENKILGFWFGVRRGEIAGFRGSSRPSLLMDDRSGTYSSARRCYIRKTRYHRYRALPADLAPVVKAYRSLQKLGMSSWKEHDAGARKEITRWKHRVMDAYWDVAPEKHKASAIERYFRARYQRGMFYPALALQVAIVVGRLSSSMLLGRFEASFRLLLILVAFCLYAWVLVIMVERFVTVRWPLCCSQIHDVLEFELAN